MRNLTNASLLVVLAASLALTICCGPPPTTGPGDNISVTPNGPSAHLARLEGPPLYSLEKVGDVEQPSFAADIPISHAGQLVVAGWAVDRTAKVAAGGVDVAIDGKAYAAEYGAPRNDVAEYFKTPAYDASGYRFSAAAAAFDKGKHRLALRVLNVGKTGYWEGATFAIELR
jgi:hypothetical protein